MTICIAALCRWNYATAPFQYDFGVAAITVSDRMVTVNDIEYEPPQLKLGAFTPNIVGLIAGDFTVQSECMRVTQRQITGRRDIKPFEVAQVYSQAIKANHSRLLEDLYLAPFNLNTEGFLAQQREMSEREVERLSTLMLEHVPADLATLIVGMDEGNAHIYQVDRNGTISCFDDTGFASIGIGAVHATASFARAKYCNNFLYPEALATAYAAKKAAESAPGVGTGTEVHLVTRDGAMALDFQEAHQLEVLFAEYQSKQQTLIDETIGKLRTFTDAKRAKREEQKAGVFAQLQKQIAGRNETDANANSGDKG